MPACLRILNGKKKWSDKSEVIFSNLLEDKETFDVSCTTSEITVFIELCAFQNSGLNWTDLIMGTDCQGKLYDQFNLETNDEGQAEKVGFIYGVDECSIQQNGFNFTTFVEGEFGLQDR